MNCLISVGLWPVKKSTFEGHHDNDRLAGICPESLWTKEALAVVDTASGGLGNFNWIKGLSHWTTKPGPKYLITWIVCIFNSFSSSSLDTPALVLLV